MELYKKKKVNGKNRIFKGEKVMSWKEIVEELNLHSVKETKENE